MGAVESVVNVAPVIKEVKYIDSNAVLLKLAQEPGLCFLDSAKRDEFLGRFSYIGIDPFLMIRSKNGVIQINDENFHGNPFNYLKIQLQQYQSTSNDCIPPFQGGAMGYFGYDLLHHLENIPKPMRDDMNVPDMCIGFYDCMIAMDHVQKKSWIISQGFPEKEENARRRHAERRAAWLYEKINEECKVVFKDQWSICSKNKIESNFTQESYHKAIKKVVDYIYDGDIFQANIAQCFSSFLPKHVKPIDLYAALRIKNPSPFSAFIQFDDVAIASASPERFILLHNNQVQTRPIKGTRRRGKTTEEDKKISDELIFSEKDRAENTMIVDLMRNDLSRVCLPDSIHVVQLCGLESYETVHHLVSVIEGKLKPTEDAISLLKATFPGGSITGAPKIRAMEIIHEIEQTNRGAYCGSIGYIGFDGNMDTSIVIRTYTITGNRVYFQAGGGILAESNLQEEYEETLTKASALRKVLQGEEKIHDLAD